MDLSNPTLLFSGLLTGCLGMGIFMYGKKQTSPKCLLAGGFLCVFPYFATSLALLWMITGACLAGLYLSSRQA